MLYPLIYCTQDGTVCQITIGEGGINAATSMMAFALSRKFDLRRTYFIISGIAGVNPKYATLGSVALARYTTQVTLQYEVDARSIPHDWPTGYIPYGRSRPLQYPLLAYGTEVFEVNSNLLEAAFKMASNATLTDSRGAQEYRTKYAPMEEVYQMAVGPPSLVKCDGTTSDAYFSGVRLAEAFENTTSIWTNGSATYCTSAQEENATLEVMLRAAIEGLVDFGRIIVMRAGMSPNA
jgi:purine nucleoside permease